MSLPQTVEFYKFDASRIEETLQLESPPFVPDDVARKQLRYVLRYAASLGSTSVAIEDHYIDRDHIEDHSSFYSKNFKSYGNWCQRVHFFRSDLDISSGLQELLELGCREGDERHRSECRRFSEKYYLGFCVIKPLPGSPVGRTVLRPFAEESSALDFSRYFGGVKEYECHLCGNPLFITGLAFQQQDLGVSACATTAIWASLQKARVFEEIGSATPSQITALASRYALPFGRAMPSEGLSIDQMCQAIQAIGVSPNIYRTDDFSVARSYLHAACKSGISAILLLKSPSANWHAVTVAGMKVAKTHSHVAVSADLPHTGEFASDLRALYVHDDRHGPYLRADLDDRPRGPSLRISLDDNGGGEEWDLRHILVPVHGKIRLSFADLSQIALQIEAVARVWLGDIGHATSIVTIGTSILRSTTYINDLLSPTIRVETISRLCRTVKLPRYVAVVRLESDQFDPVEMLVDTTGTLRSAHCLVTVGIGNSNPNTAPLVQYLATEFECAGIC